MSGYPEEWMREFKDQQAFVTDPAGRCAEVSQMAYDMHRRREITAEQLEDMLELADAGREWGLGEHEEAWDIGIFRDCPPLEDACRIVVKCGQPDEG